MSLLVARLGCPAGWCRPHEVTLENAERRDVGLALDTSLDTDLAHSSCLDQELVRLEA